MSYFFRVIGGVAGFIAIFGIGIYFFGLESVTGGCVQISNPVQDLRSSDSQIQNEAYDTVVAGQDKYVSALIESLGNLETESDIIGSALSINALAEIGPPAVDPLIEALEGSNDYVVRTGAAQALGMISDPVAVEPLIAGLKDNNELVRTASASSLGKIGDPRAIEPLGVAVGDTNYSVSEAASRALIEISMKMAN